MKSSCGTHYSDKLIKLLDLENVQFKSLPPFTDAADVPENIVHWRYKGDYQALNDYTRFDTIKGRRFVNCSDFEETVTLIRTVRKRPVVITLHRTVETPDHFCPLEFRERFVDIYLVTDTEDIQIFNTNQFLREVFKL